MTTVAKQVAAQKTYRTMWRCFWQSLPALLVPLILAGFVWAGRRATATGTITAKYSLAADQALRSKDFEAAEIYFRKLLRLNERNAAAQYGLALTAEKRKDLDRARRLMAQIAPPDRSGYPAAHVWLARDLSQQGLPKEAAKQAAWASTIEQHLRHALEKEPQDRAARLTLARLYRAGSKYKQSAEELARLVDASPELRFELAQLQAALGNREQARQQAGLAQAFYADRLKQNEGDVEAALRLGLVQIFQEQYDQAGKTLQAGLARSKDERFRDALAALSMKQYQAEPSASLGRKLQLLQRVLGYAPNHLPAIQQLAALLGTGGPEAVEARKLLGDILARGDAPPLTHFVLGTLAADRGDTAEAVLHLEQAYRAQPNLAAVANNLAWVYANQPEPRLDSALKLADAAIEAAPQHPEIRETRGLILFKLARWKEAITDLEFALTAFPDRPRVHSLLADAYQQLGQTELADRHRELAAEKPPQASPSGNP